MIYTQCVFTRSVVVTYGTAMQKREVNRYFLCLIAICKTNQTLLNTLRTTDSITPFHAKWSLQYFSMCYEVSKKCARLEKRIQHLSLSILFIINLMQHICTEQLQNQIAKKCTLKCLYYLLTSTLLFFLL